MVTNRKSRVAIVTNSAIALPHEMIKDYNIRLVPPSFTMDGHTYRDSEDIQLEDVYAYLEKGKPFLTTPGSPYDYLEAYREVAQRASAILCLTIPRKLSTMFDSARTAMEMAGEAIPEVPIRVLDCGSLAGAQGLIVLAAATKAVAGESLEQVITATETAIRATDFLLLFKTVRYAARTGRLPRMLAEVGNLLGVKGLITIADGRVKMVSLHRSMAAGIQRLIKVTAERAGNTPVMAIVMHSGYSKEVEEFAAWISGQLKCKQILLSQFSPIVAYIAGPGALGVAFCPTHFLYPESEFKEIR
ncbi:DegV family protein [Chloroflexota bacterium]